MQVNNRGKDYTTPRQYVRLGRNNPENRPTTPNRIVRSLDQRQVLSQPIYENVRSSLDRPVSPRVVFNYSGQMQKKVEAPRQIMITSPINKLKKISEGERKVFQTFQPINKSLIGGNQPEKYKQDKLKMQTSQYIMVDKHMKIVNREEKNNQFTQNQRRLKSIQNQDKLKDSLIQQKQISYDLFENVQEIQKKLNIFEEQNIQLKAKVSTLQLKLKELSKQKTISSQQKDIEKEELTFEMRKYKIQTQRLTNLNQIFRLNQLQMEKKIKNMQTQLIQKDKQLNKLRQIKKRPSHEIQG